MIKVEVGLCGRYAKYASIWPDALVTVYRLASDSSVLVRGVLLSGRELLLRRISGPTTAVARFLRNCQDGCVDVGLVNDDLTGVEWRGARLRSVGLWMHNCGFSLVEDMRFAIGLSWGLGVREYIYDQPARW